MTLQQQASDLIYDLPEDSISIIIELIKKLIPSARARTTGKTGTGLILGIAKGEFEVDDEIVDAADAEIDEMFGDPA